MTAIPAPHLISEAPPTVTMNVDITQAKRFVELLAGDADAAVTFQTFDDSDAARAGLARVFHGTLDQHAGALIKLNQQGAGVFVMVNQGDGIVHDGNTTCRTNANVVKVRAVFVDLDGTPLEPVLESGEHPDIVIESSPGRWHAYWLTADTTLDEFTACQLALAGRFGGDPSVKDRARVMRLPGFYHQKNKPFMSRIVFPSAEPNDK